MKQTYTLEDLKEAYRMGSLQSIPDQCLMETKQTFEQLVKTIEEKKELEALKVVANILERNGVRKHLNKNDFGYSDIEREIVKQLLKIK